MSKSNAELLELARQGNSQAIAKVLNHYLKPKKVEARVKVHERKLHVLLESHHTLDVEIASNYVHSLIKKMALENIEEIHIYHQQAKEDFSHDESSDLEKYKTSAQPSDVNEQNSLEKEPIYLVTERDRKFLENLKRHNLSDKQIADIFNPQKPHFGCLIYWLWLFFGLCALTTLSQLFRGNLDSVLKLSLLSLVAFPPIPAFLGKIIAPKLPKYRLFTKGIRDLLYSFSLILFLSFASQFITSNSSKSSPRTTDTPSTIQRTNQSGSDTRRRELSNSDQLGRCQDEQIARGATVEEILEACEKAQPAAQPQSTDPLSQEEARDLLCSEVKKDPSHPWYSDCF